MRVVLQILSGPDAGRKAQLGAGQALKVGRTEWADFTVSHDGHLSGVHFALETDNTNCYIEDLGSSNGTFLNDRPIGEKTALGDGDEIRAGETLFVVRTAGDLSGETVIPASEAAARGVARAPAPAAAPAPKGRIKAAYTVETCNSGLTLCRGSIDEIQPAQLAALLSENIPVYLIVDFKNLGSLPPDDLGQPHYLFDWLEPDAAATVSPVVLSQNDSAAWSTLVGEGWGNDAVICLFSKQDKTALLEHLHRCIRAKPDREDLSGGIVGYCWPSVMAMLLAHGTPSYVRRLLAGIDAVLVELPDLPETWQVYGVNQVAELLGRLGLVRQPPEEAASSNSEDRT